MEIRNYRDSAPQQNDIQERRIEKVTTGRKVQKSLGNKVLSEIIADDIQEVGSWFFHDVVIPSFKNVLSDGFNALLFGPDNGRRYGYSGGSNTIRRITPYSSLYNGYSNRVTNNNAQQDRIERRRGGIGGYSCQDILIEYNNGESRRDTECRARDVLTQMRIYLNKYNYVSVGDFYDAVGETPEKEDHNWGWYDLSGAYLRANGEGIVIHMPKPESLD